MRAPALASIARNTGFLLGAQGVTSAARLVYAVVLATFLGPELYGLFNYGLAWYLAFLPLSNLGLSAIMSREIGRDREGGAAIVGRAAALRVLATASAAVACLAAGWLTESSPEMRRLLLVFSLALFGRGFALWTNGVFAAYESTQHTLRQEAAFRIAEVAVGTAVLAAGGGVLTLATMHAAIWWLQALIGLGLIRRHLVALRADWNRTAMLTLLATGLPLGLADVLQTWLLQGPLVLFRHGGGAGDALGELALAMQAFISLGALTRAVAVAGLPVLSRSARRGDGTERVLVDGMVRAGMLFAAVAGLAGMALGPSVALIFGPRYAQTGALLGLSLWLLVPLSCGSTLSHALFARGQVAHQVTSSAAGAVALTVSIPLLVPLGGAAGPIGAAALGLGTWTACLLVPFLRARSIDIGQAIGRPAVATMLAVGAYLTLRPLGGMVALAGSLVCLAGGAILLGVLGPGERRPLGLLRPGFSGRSGGPGGATDSGS